MVAFRPPFLLGESVDGSMITLSVLKELEKSLGAFGDGLTDLLAAVLLNSLNSDTHTSVRNRCRRKCRLTLMVVARSST